MTVSPVLAAVERKGKHPLPHDNWACGQFNLIGAVAGATLNSVTVTLDGTYDPGNPETTIYYTLPEEGQITNPVYDVMGCHVQALVNTVQPAGKFSVQWNGFCAFFQLSGR